MHCTASRTQVLLSCSTNSYGGSINHIFVLFFVSYAHISLISDKAPSLPPNPNYAELQCTFFLPCHRNDCCDCFEDYYALECRPSCVFFVITYIAAYPNRQAVKNKAPLTSRCQFQKRTHNSIHPRMTLPLLVSWYELHISNAGRL